jgi:hypothetical protein
MIHALEAALTLALALRNEYLRSSMSHYSEAGDGPASVRPLSIPWSLDMARICVGKSRYYGSLGSSMGCGTEAENGRYPSFSGKQVTIE